MKTAILYAFSGTGNTMTAAKLIAQQLESIGYQTRVVRILRISQDIPDPREYDVAGFGFPVHAINVPRLALSYVRRLPNVFAIPAFIFKTCGDPFCADVSSYKLYRTLKRHGFDVCIDTCLVMPNNILTRCPDALSKQMYLHTRAMSHLIALRVHAGERDCLQYPLRLRLFSAFLRIEWLGAYMNGLLYHTKKKLCTLCGLCVKSCPAQNIRIDNGQVRFLNHCTMCMACSMCCPNDAVRPGLLSPIRINGYYHFPSLVVDKRTEDRFKDENTKGHAGLRKYYRQTYAQLESHGITV